MNEYSQAYEKMMEAQKQMYDAWLSIVAPDEETRAKFDFGNYDPLEFYKQITEKNNEYFGQFSKTPKEVLEKMRASTQAYFELYKLYEKFVATSKDLKSEEAKEAYEVWKDRYTEWMKENYLSYLPESIQNLSNQAMELIETYRETTMNFWDPWVKESEELVGDWFKSAAYDPDAYTTWLKEWKERYDVSFRKLLDTPMIGYWREYLEKQQDSVGKYIDFVFAANAFYGRVYEVAQQTTREVLEEFQTKAVEGASPQSYEDFCQYWTKKINAAYDSLFFSDDFSVISGKMVDAMSEFKIESDKLVRASLKTTPIPTKFDLDPIYKDLYDLKREQRKLRSSVEELTARVEELSTENATLREKQKPVRATTARPAVKQQTEEKKPAEKATEAAKSAAEDK